MATSICNQIATGKPNSMLEQSLQGSSDLGVIVKDDSDITSLRSSLEHDSTRLSQAGGRVSLPTIETVSTKNVKTEDDTQIVLSSVRLAPPVPNVEHPRKRQRVIMDMVLVPSLAEVQRKKDKCDDDLEKLKKLFKPKKKTDMSLGDDILASRLKPIGLDIFPVNLPRAEVNQMVSRLFMSSVYSGSMQATRPKISTKKLAEHGLNDFMYLHPKYHPYAPQCPGRNGLFFRPEQYGEPWEGVRRLFTRDEDRPAWQYMGQYHVKTTASLTLDEWLGLKNIRNNWVREIHAKGWGRGVRARIQARKELAQLGPGREPTKEEAEAVRKSGRWKRTTQDDVRMAFDCGKERMEVWTMRCVGYDDRFQLELYRKYPNWTPPESSKLKKKGIKEEATQEWSHHGSEAWTNSEPDSDVIDEEEEVLMKIRTRGTKSRPICL